MTEAEELELLELEEEAANAQESSFSESIKENVTDPLGTAATSFAESIPVLGTYLDDYLSWRTGKPVEEIKDIKKDLYFYNPEAKAVGEAAAFTSTFMLPTGATITKASPAVLKLAQRLGITPTNAARLLKVSQAASIGAVSGGLSKPMEGDNRAENALLGGLLGGGTQAGFEGVQKISDLLGGRKLAERLAFKSMSPSASEEKEFIKDRGRSVGRTLLDKDILSGIFPSKEKMLSRVEDVAEKEGDKIGQFISKADGAANLGKVINREDISRKVINDIKINTKDRNFIEDITKLNDEIEKMVQGGDLSIQEAQELKVLIQDRINYAKKPGLLPTEPMKAKVDRSERDALASELSKKIKEYTPNNSTAYEASKEAYSNLLDAKPILERSVGVDRANPILNRAGGFLPGVGLYGAAHLLNKPALGASMGVLFTAGNIARKYGLQTAAKFLDAQKNSVITPLQAQSIWQILENDNELKKKVNLNREPQSFRALNEAMGSPPAGMSIGTMGMSLGSFLGRNQDYREAELDKEISEGRNIRVPKKEEISISDSSKLPSGISILPPDARKKLFDLLKKEKGEVMFHGTNRNFDEFKEGVKSRKGSSNVDKFYFTDNPSIADRFSKNSGDASTASFSGFQDMALRYGWNDDFEDYTDFLNEKFQKDKDKKDFYIQDWNGENLIPIKDFNSKEVQDYLQDDGEILVYPKGQKPRIIKAKLSGKILDLTDPNNIPKDLSEKLKKEGRFNPSERTLPNWDHEYSKALINYAKEKGYGRIKVLDGYESGFKSTIALPDFIKTIDPTIGIKHK